MKKRYWHILAAILALILSQIACGQPITPTPTVDPSPSAVTLTASPPPLTPTPPPATLTPTPRAALRRVPPIGGTP